MLEDLKGNGLFWTNKQITLFELGFWSSCETNFSESDTRMAGGKPVGCLQSVVNLSQGSPKTNPESGQNEIWTRNFRMQIQHADP